MTADAGKAEVLHAFVASVFTNKVCQTSVSSNYQQWKKTES